MKRSSFILMCAMAIYSIVLISDIFAAREQVPLYIVETYRSETQVIWKCQREYKSNATCTAEGDTIIWPL